MKKLKDPKPSSEKFFLVADRLEKKLGPILFQLPPRWKLNVERLAEFLEALPGEHRYAFEFRDESWLVPEVFQLLRKYKAAFCVHDFADMKMPVEITADFAYIRFHGPTSAKYWGSYSDGSCESGLSGLMVGAVSCRQFMFTLTTILRARRSGTR